MGRTKSVVFAFDSPRKAADATVLAQGAHTVSAARQNFMRVALVTDIPNDPIIRRIKHRVHRDSEFNRAQV